MTRAIQAVLMAVALLASGCAGSDDAGPAGAADEAATAETPAANETTGSVHGTVSDDEGKPLPKANVGIVGLAHEATLNTTADGSFTFNGVPPGNYKLLVNKIGYEPYGATVDVVANEVATVEVRLSPLELGPEGPQEIVMNGLKTQGIWFLVPYATAAAHLPEGYTAKPHVLLEPNDAVAEYHVYASTYDSMILDGVPIASAGGWVFECLSVVPPDEHARGSTVEFIVLASYATDPAVAQVLSGWNVPTQVADSVALSITAAADEAASATGSLQASDASFAVASGHAGRTDSLTGGSITVRMFGFDGDSVSNYVDLDLSGLFYSISGASVMTASSGLAINPPAPTGEGYVQWGDSAIQVVRRESV